MRLFVEEGGIAAGCQKEAAAPPKSRDSEESQGQSKPESGPRTQADVEKGRRPKRKDALDQAGGDVNIAAGGHKKAAASPKSQTAAVAISAVYVA